VTWRAAPWCDDCDDLIEECGGHDPSPPERDLEDVAAEANADAWAEQS
jgi:hypothetical protein